MTNRFAHTELPAGPKRLWGRRLAGALVLAGAVTAGGLGPSPRAVAAAPLVQPGEYVETPTAICTLAFVFAGASGGPQAGRTFVATAAHCVGSVGEPASLSDGTVFGHVALIGDANAFEADYAFIEVGAGALGRVSPAVKGHPTMPTGSTVSSGTAVGDRVLQSGYGMGFEYTAATRESRQSVLTYDNHEAAGVAGAVIFGDSGGPLMHAASGKALGIVSRACINACEEEGPTIEGVLAKADARGWKLRIRTV
ncbi:MAG TPA: trypsin-like serine protease [Acidimicrobiales bacterium]|jgi:hypothetical protein|nr:trypsin-like serine protease [Acidimicrobiales bacterium]